MSNPSLESLTESLAATPNTLAEMLGDLSADLATANDGPGTWSAFDVLGHLIHAEKENWLPRIRMILSRDSSPFTPFDPQFLPEQPAAMTDRLEAFAALREANLETLDGFDLEPESLTLTGTHPEFGRVTLHQLLTVWMVHDWSHIAQISRVLARQFRDAVGPWRAFLPILG